MPCFPAELGRTQRQAALLSPATSTTGRRQIPASPPSEPVPQSDDQPGPDGRASAGRGLRAPALGRILPQGRLCDVAGARSRRTIASTRTCPAQDRNQRLDLRQRATVRAAARCRRSLIKGRYGEPILTRIYNNYADRSATRQRRLRPQRDASCISTTPTTARRATAPPTCTTSPAPSTTTAGARPWPGATRSTRRPPIKKASGPNGNGGLVQRRRRLPRAAGHAVGARPPLLLHRRERLQGQARHGELLQRARTAATRS